MQQRLEEMMREGGCARPNAVLEAARRLFRDGATPQGRPRRRSSAERGLPGCGAARCLEAGGVLQPGRPAKRPAARLEHFDTHMSDAVLQAWTPRGASAHRMC